jgi:hypothetical protein
MQEFDWVFNGDDVLGTRGVDAVDHRRERRRFARAGHPRDEHHAARFLADAFGDGRQEQLLERPDLGGNHAQNDADISSLLEDVHTEAAQTGGAVSQVDLRAFLELLLLAGGHHAECHVEHLFGSDARLIGQRHQFAIHAQMRIIAYLQVKVTGLTLHRNAQ